MSQDNASAITMRVERTILDSHVCLPTNGRHIMLEGLSLLTRYAASGHAFLTVGFSRSDLFSSSFLPWTQLFMVVCKLKVWTIPAPSQPSGRGLNKPFEKKTHHWYECTHSKKAISQNWLNRYQAPLVAWQCFTVSPKDFTNDVIKRIGSQTWVRTGMKHGHLNKIWLG